MSRHYKLDKENHCLVEISRNESKRTRNALGAGWPRTCWASGVGSNQAQELRDFFKSHGESVEVTGGGDPIYTSMRHRKKCLALRGMHDKRSFN